MPSNKGGLNFTIKNKELLDQSVLLEKGTIKNVDMQILSFKKDGKFENPADEARVKEFMDVVKEFRATL